MLSMTRPGPGRASLQFCRQRQDGRADAANGGGGEDRRRPDRGARRADPRPPARAHRAARAPAGSSSAATGCCAASARAASASSGSRTTSASTASSRSSGSRCTTPRPARAPSARRRPPRGSRTRGSSRCTSPAATRAPSTSSPSSCAGRTLGELMEEGALSDRDVLRVGVALCDALAHAHGRGVVHRDVKPGNVMVPDRPHDGAGVAKLTDFGVARIAGEDVLTRTGDVVGTLAYMAPEQAEGREAGAEADLYALALVLYEALAGVNPVRGRGAASTARRVGARLPALGRLRRDLPLDLCGAIDRAVLPRPEQRGTLADLRDGARGRAARRGRRRRARSRAARSRASARRAVPRGPHAPASRAWLAGRRRRRAHDAPALALARPPSRPLPPPAAGAGAAALVVASSRAPAGSPLAARPRRLAGGRPARAGSRSSSSPRRLPTAAAPAPRRSRCGRRPRSRPCSALGGPRRRLARARRAGRAPVAPRSRSARSAPGGSCSPRRSPASGSRLGPRRAAAAGAWQRVGGRRPRRRARADRHARARSCSRRCGRSPPLVLPVLVRGRVVRARPRRGDGLGRRARLGDAGGGARDARPGRRRGRRRRRSRWPRERHAARRARVLPS